MPDDVEGTDPDPWHRVPQTAAASEGPFTPSSPDPVPPAGSSAPPPGSAQRGQGTPAPSPSWPWPPPVLGTAGGPPAPPARGAFFASGPPPGAPSGQGPTVGGGGERPWPTARLVVLVAVVAALIGAGVGAGVTAATKGGGSTLTVNESRSGPGAATLGGKVSIPKLVQEVLPAIVSIDVTAGDEEDQGTGMIISATGKVITNNHVIALAESGGSITVTRSGTTKQQPASLVGADPIDDVALLQIKGASGLPTVTFGNSTKAEVGDAVVAIGNALGLAAGSPTVTQGIVSALGRTVTAGDGGSSETLTNMIQTDAAINPGNSGGPLIDTAGQVVAMNTAVAGGTGDGTQAQNIGFAIPAATIESLLPELEKGGTIKSGGGALGVTVTTLTTQLRQQYGFTPTSGAVVLSVLAGSPADRAGIREGDVIVAIDTTKVTTAEALDNNVAKRKPGTQVHLTVYVGYLRETLTATLESQAEEQQQQTATHSATTRTTTPTPTTGISPFGALAP